MRQGVRKLLRRIGLSIVAEGDDYHEACGGLYHAIKPALVLVIVSRAEQLGDGLNAMRSAAARFAEAKLILLAEGIGEAGVLAAAASGANAVLSPKLSSSMLSNSVQLVLMNQNLLPAPPAAVPENVAGRVAGTLQKAVPADTAPERPTEPATAAASREAKVVLGPRPEDALVPPRPAAALLNLVWNSGEPVVTNSARPMTPSDREWEILQCLANGVSNKSIARQLGIAETTVKVHVKSLLRKLGVANRTQAAIWALNHGQPAAEPVVAEAARAVQGD